MSAKLIRSHFIHDVTASDSLNGLWHDGYRPEDGERIAFYFRRAWYRSDPNQPAVTGPFKTMEQAIQSP